MALENILERIAIALETLVEQHLKGSVPAAKDTQDTADVVSSTETPLGGKAEGPAKTTTPQDPPPAGTELDPRGLPWDARINNSKRTKNVTYRDVLKKPQPILSPRAATTHNVEAVVRPRI